MTNDATESLTLDLPRTLRERLERVAERLERTPGDCVQMALTEFLDTWEDHLNDVDRLREGEERPRLEGGEVRALMDPPDGPDADGGGGDGG